MLSGIFVKKSRREALLLHMNLHASGRHFVDFTQRDLRCACSNTLSCAVVLDALLATSALTQGSVPVLASCRRCNTSTDLDAASGESYATMSSGSGASGASLCSTKLPSNVGTLKPAATAALISEMPCSGPRTLPVVVHRDGVGLSTWIEHLMRCRQDTARRARLLCMPAAR